MVIVILIVILIIVIVTVTHSKVVLFAGSKGHRDF